MENPLEALLLAASSRRLTATLRHSTGACLQRRAIPSTIVVAPGPGARDSRKRAGSLVGSLMNVSILVCGCGLKVRRPGGDSRRVGRAPNAAASSEFPTCRLSMTSRFELEHRTTPTPVTLMA